MNIKIFICLTFLLVGLSGCDKSDENIEIAKEITKVEETVKIKCGVKAYVASEVLNGKIKYIKLIFFDIDKTNCDNGELVNILNNFANKNFGYSNIDYFIEYNKNNKVSLEQIQMRL